MRQSYYDLSVNGYSFIQDIKCLTGRHNENLSCQCYVTCVNLFKSIIERICNDGDDLTDNKLSMLNIIIKKHGIDLDLDIRDLKCMEGIYTDAVSPSSNRTVMANDTVDYCYQFTESLYVKVIAWLNENKLTRPTTNRLTELFRTA